MNWKKRLVGYIVLFLLLAAATYLVASVRVNGPVLQPSEHVAAAASNATPAANLAWPSYGESAIGASGYGVLATSGSQVAFPTASTAKLLTALAVLKAKPLAAGQTQTPLLTITAADVASYNQYVAEDGSVILVTAGEQFSEYQALQAMLLPSANNMAYALAVWAFGSIDAYTAYANSLAAQMGFKSTHTVDASGFLPGTVSSASNLTLLGEAALKNPVIADIVSQRSAVLPTAGTIYNTNALLGKDGIIGLKTGNNDQDKGCYVFGGQITLGGKPLTIVGATMGAPNLAAAMAGGQQLLTSAKQYFSYQSAITKGQVLATYKTPWGKTIKAVASQNVTLLSWNHSPASISLKLQPLRGSDKQGDTIGTASAASTIGTEKLTTNVILQQALTSPPWSWRLTHVF